MKYDRRKSNAQVDAAAKRQRGGCNCMPSGTTWIPWTSSKSLKSNTDLPPVGPLHHRGNIKVPLLHFGGFNL
jgi:hypothetical protein